MNLLNPTEQISWVRHWLLLIVEISSGLTLSYEIRFVGLGQDITNTFGSIRVLLGVFLFGMSLLVYSGATV
jgi:hypothetical protein